MFDPGGRAAAAGRGRFADAVAPAEQQREEGEQWQKAEKEPGTGQETHFLDAFEIGKHHCEECARDG